ncbi:MAG: hypothetical protein JXD22_10585 [Sedimentisphaerales bacterium]|nr:hypothetical protein [Sedimentisphaerales bacterium]
MPESVLIPEQWNVPQIFRDRVGDKLGRQRAMFADGHLLLLLSAPTQNIQAERRPRVFWRNPQGAWLSCMGDGKHFLARHLEEISELVEKLDQQQDKAQLIDEYFAVLEKEVMMKRMTRNLLQALQQAREMIQKDKDIINFRDKAAELESSVELLFGDAHNGLDFAVARRQENQTQSSMHMARSTHRLNILAAFFFPLMTLSTLFGMNLAMGWENRYAPWPFLAVLAVGVISGLILLGVLTAKNYSPAQSANSRRWYELSEKETLKMMRSEDV